MLRWARLRLGIAMRTRFCRAEWWWGEVVCGSSVIMTRQSLADSAFPGRACAASGEWVERWKTSSELREMSDEQIRLTWKDAAEHLFRLRIQAQTERLDAPSELRRQRRLIARCQTILNERRIGWPNELCRGQAGNEDACGRKTTAKKCIASKPFPPSSARETGHSENDVSEELGDSCPSEWKSAW